METEEGAVVEEKSMVRKEKLTVYLEKRIQKRLKNILPAIHKWKKDENLEVTALPSQNFVSANPGSLSLAIRLNYRTSTRSKNIG